MLNGVNVKATLGISRLHLEIFISKRSIQYLCSVQSLINYINVYDPITNNFILTHDGKLQLF